MDIFQAARFFDIQDFDVYDFPNAIWKNRKFQGQLKKTDTFTEIWNRPTRKRLLTCAPDQVPNVPVIRVSDTGEIFMVGASHKDAWGGYYRFVSGLHLVRSQALVRRREPAGPSNNPGWAVTTLTATTFGDAELRSADENQDRAIEHYGSYFLFLPSNTVLKRDDTVEIEGRTYFVIEWYLDSGLVSARATVEPDDRIDVVYVQLGPDVYNTSTQQNTRSETPYNVTGRLRQKHSEESHDENVLATELRFMIRRSWIGVTPKNKDLIQVGSKRYEIEDIEINALLDEYYFTLKT